MIICLSHSGIHPSEDRKSYIGEDIELAEKVSGIDIIISGHTHVKTPKPIKINNTYIVQTGNNIKNLGEIKLKVDKGAITEFDFRLIPVDDKITGTENIHNMIKEQIEFINHNYLSKSGLKYDMPIAETNFDLTLNYMKLRQSNLGPFIADADKYYLKQ